VSLADLVFPKTIYRSPTARTVVCQLRFHPVLRIGTELPVLLQDAIRDQFPKYAQEETFTVRLGSRPELAPPAPTVHRFESQDGQWIARLAVDFFSVETARGYRRYSEFLEIVDRVRKRVEHVYSVADYERIGLRYINVFEKGRFEGRWNRWINETLLGPIGDANVGASVVHADQFLALSEDSWSIGVRHGIRSEGYLLDLDHYTEQRTASGKAHDLLCEFNLRLYRLFRWAITEEAHRALGPEENVE
jgi:uncharacterized protein (TIGR04255 family)